MGFITYTFLFVFLPLTLGVYYVARGRGRLWVLTMASFVFYGWWRVDCLGLLLGVMILTYALVLKIHRVEDPRLRLRWITATVVAHLLFLGFFKYFNFGMTSLSQWRQMMGMPAVSWSEVILPIGISFYTFHLMSYSIDVYRRRAEPTPSFLHFACYIVLFPQLVAGPIVRYNTISAQLVSRTHTLEKFGRGVMLFMMGFAKKVLIADSLARVADDAFGGGHHGWVDSWLGLYAYTMQIYFDFSGYSDMAIGLGRLFGFEFLKNFDSPYCSRSITEFWKRWHMSLSQWLRDYLYIPLGGNRHGTWSMYRNLLVTMLFGGIWHGANWCFLLWGLYQGVLLIVERLRERHCIWSCGVRALERPVTFFLVMMGWVIFRAPDMATLGIMLEGLSGMNGWGDLVPLLPALRPSAVTALVVSGILVWGCPQSWDLAERVTLSKACLFIGLFLVAILKMIFTSYTPFLYFQF